MTSAPWWLVLVTVPITGVITLSGVWLAARFNLQGRREDQQHSAGLEREKELYNRRVDLYYELTPVIDKIMRAVPGQFQVEVDGERKVRLIQEEYDPLEALLGDVRQLQLKVQIISGILVRGTLHDFIWQYRLLLAGYNTFSFAELALQANNLVRDIRLEIGAASRGSIEELPYEEIYGLEQ